MDYKKRYPIGKEITIITDGDISRDGKVVGYWHDDNESGITIMSDNNDIPFPVEFVVTDKHILTPRKYGDDDE